MKKYIIALSCIIPTLAFAEITSLKFVAYSSATQQSCSILSSSSPPEGNFFKPSIGNSTVYNLDTKGYRTFTISPNDLYLKIRCFATATGIYSSGVAVKMLLNAGENKLYPITEEFIKTK